MHKRLLLLLPMILLVFPLFAQNTDDDDEDVMSILRRRLAESDTLVDNSGGIRWVSPEEIHTNRDKSDKQFNFIYIAHDVTTPVAHLVTRLREVYRDAIQFNNEVLFYLANGLEPVLVRVNMPGDNRDDFDNVLIAELQIRNSHETFADLDIDNMMKVLYEDDFVNGQNELLYTSCFFDFYVGNSFWKLGNNKSVIAAMYFTLGAQKFERQQKEFFFNVFYPSNDTIEYAEGEPFGGWNIDNMNKKVLLKPY